jgi:adenylate cyclase
MEAYQRGLWHASKESVDENGLARAFFEQAIALDPAFASAYSELAWTYHADGSTYASRPYRDAMQLAIQTAEKALSIDQSDAEAHAAIGAALINLADFPLATFHFQRALAVNPNSARAYRGLAAPFLYRGQPARGREMLNSALRLSPRGETAARVRAQIAMSYYFERDYPAALTAAQQAIAEIHIILGLIGGWRLRWASLGMCRRRQPRFRKRLKCPPSRSGSLPRYYGPTSGRKTTSTC